MYYMFHLYSCMRDRESLCVCVCLSAHVFISKTLIIDGHVNLYKEKCSNLSKSVYSQCTQIN